MTINDIFAFIGILVRVVIAMETDAHRRLQLLVGHLYNEEDFSALDMEETCGIVGYVSRTEHCLSALLKGLRILENRGYDSAGIATLSSSAELCITKLSSPSEDTHTTALDILEKVAPERHNTATVGIAHTRWATHGARTDTNAHPHTDGQSRFAIVHNGVITNYAELRKMLQENGYSFSTETDTEVIAQCIAMFLDRGMDVRSAIVETQTLLEGTWGVVLLHRDEPDSLYAFCHGSPLLVGLAEDKLVIASEFAAFVGITKDYVRLHPREVCVLKPGSLISEPKHEIQVAQVEDASPTPDPYPDWTIKEISQQPWALMQSTNNGGRLLSDSMVKLGGLEQHASVLAAVQHLVIAASGSSLHAGMFGAHVLRMLGPLSTVTVCDAAELNNHMLPRESTALCLLSQSGETRDVYQCIQRFGKLPMFAVVNVVGSMIANDVPCGVHVNAGRENGVASTKAFTCTALVMVMVAIWYAQKYGVAEQERKLLIDAVHSFPMRFGTALQCRQKCTDIARAILASGSKSLFVLGSGWLDPIAREGALKIKEISYLHAEAYASSALKHGPLALIEKGTPVIALLLEGDNHAALEEVKSRGALLIVISTKHVAIADFCVTVPQCRNLTALLMVAPLQWIAYTLSLQQGLNPDRPRNLAKAVTVQ